MKWVVVVFRKTFYACEFFLIYAWEMTKANVAVARDAYSATFRMSPGFIKVPLDVKSDDEILTLGNLATMTPGSITVDVPEDRKHLFVHVLFVEDADKSRSEIKDVLEKRVQRLFE
jgi:multicomponent Na+:H+ antiporter subunit E